MKDKINPTINTGKVIQHILKTNTNKIAVVVLTKGKTIILLKLRIPQFVILIAVQKAGRFPPMAAKIIANDVPNIPKYKVRG